MAESETEIEAASTGAILDPVFSAFELPLRGIFHPLGFTVEILTNSQEVIASAEESWGRFHKMFPEPPARLQIGVMEGGLEDCPPIPVCRARDNLLVNIADVENFTVCDVRRGFAFGWVTQAAVADRAYFRYYFLEATVSILLQSLYSTPLHAGLVMLEGRGVLLCGDAGAGKSSLAFSCAQNGWTYLSDDSSCLIRNRNDRVVVGNPFQVRFREAAIDLFPELKNYRVAARPTGKLSIELNPASMPEITTALSGTVDYIVFLNRVEPDPPSLAPFRKEAALSWLESVITFGERDLREVQAASLRRLLSVPTYELRYRDLDWAVARLEALIHEGN